MRPVIGVSCYGERARWGAWDVDAVLLHRAYVEALETSGAAVVLLPPMHDESSIDAVLEKLDGLVLAGGADLEPASYGAEPHETTDTPRLDRDATERLLYHGARQLGLPVLGICRGMQVMAVASGGALIQDLPSAGYGTAHREAPGTFTEHGATFAPGLAGRAHPRRPPSSSSTPATTRPWPTPARCASPVTRPTAPSRCSRIPTPRSCSACSGTRR